MGIPSRSRLLRWSAAVVILGLLGLGGAELFFRSFPEYLPTAAQFGVHDRALNANPINSLPKQELGYLWRPHVEARYRGYEFGFDYSTDAQGFRNPGPWPDRAEIVVLGDSEAFGFGVDDGEESVRQLAQLLPGVKVVNLGLLGAAPQRFERIYQAYGRPLRPEVVLVALFPSNAITMAALFDHWEADGKPDRYDLRRARGGAPADQDALTVIRDRLRDSYARLALHHGLRSLLGVDGLHIMAFADGGRGSGSSRSAMAAPRRRRRPRSQLHPRDRRSRAPAGRGPGGWHRDARAAVPDQGGGASAAARPATAPAGAVPSRSAGFPVSTSRRRCGGRPLRAKTSS